MKNNTQEYHVAYSKKDGFQLILSRGSSFRNAVLTVADKLCTLTFHRFCSQLCGDLTVWDDRKREELFTLSLTPEQATILSQPGTWDWMEEDK